MSEFFLSDGGEFSIYLNSRVFVMFRALARAKDDTSLCTACTSAAKGFISGQ